MKKAILLSMLSLLLVSCAAPHSDDGKEHTTEVKKNIIQTPAPYSDVKVYHYKYEGHDYQLHRVSGSDAAGITHDPECGKCKEQSKHIDIWNLEM